MQQRAFVERFLERLDKIDRTEIEAFVLRTVRERDFIARIFETLIEGIVTFDSDFLVTMANPAAMRILRWNGLRKVLGEPILGLLPPGPLHELVTEFARDSRGVRDEEMVVHARSHRVHNVHLLPMGDPDDDGSQAIAALILQDVTTTYDKRARSAEAAKISSLATLTTGVAHQIKNPLNSLSIHAQLLERAVQEFAKRHPAVEGEKIDQRILRSCEILGEEVNRLRRCVDDFIQAARPRSPVLRSGDLNAIVQSVVEISKLEFDELGIEIVTLLDPDLPGLMLDEQQMQHALRNLLRNAVEAIEAARRPPGRRRVTLRTSALGDEHVTLEVSDTGCGVPEEELPRIFEPYFTTKFNGSGLGLMAVGRIIREHKGQISVSSSPRDGTTFSIELPVLRRRVKLLTGKTAPTTDKDTQTVSAQG
ncbi:PAS domain-containing protein [Candidatus Sumerlaeota bacterium]|nr:PAS domain-containing protein [Candidatus Sumerlaeota bacterium]